MSLWIKSHKELTVLFFIILVASFLRIYDLGTESIWLDEAHSYLVSGLPLKSIIPTTVVTDQSPLYFIILHYWTRIFGSTEAALRSMSAVFGILSVLVIYKVGCALYGKRIGLTSSLLSAISLFHIHYSQEARPYSLLLFFSLLSFLFFIRILYGEPKPSRQYFYYLISNIFICCTHVFGVLIVISQMCFLLLFWKKYKQLRMKLLLLHMTTFLSFFPMMLIKRSVVTTMVYEGFWIREPTLGTLYQTIYMFCGDHLLLVIVFFLLSFTAPFLINRMKGLWTIKRPLESLAETSWRIQVDDVEKYILLVLWLFAPIIILFTISKVYIPLYTHRYLIGASPALIIVVAKGLDQITSNKLKYCVLIAILLLSSFGVKQYYTDSNKEQWREVAAYIEDNSANSDVIVFYKDYIQMPFDYYYTGELQKIGVKNPTAQHIDALLEEATDNDRLWLVLSHGGRESQLNSYMLERYGSSAVVQTKEFVEISLTLFNISLSDV